MLSPELHERCSGKIRWAAAGHRRGRPADHRDAHHLAHWCGSSTDDGPRNLLLPDRGRLRGGCRCRRLRAAWLLTDPQVRPAPAADAGSSAGSAERAASLSATMRRRWPAKRVRSFVPKSPKEMGRIERRLAGAGYHGPWPAIAVLRSRDSCCRSWCSPLIVLVTRHGRTAAVRRRSRAVIGYYRCRTCGWAAPIEARRREIQNGLPDAIDLLIVCIESGSGLDQALEPRRRGTGDRRIRRWPQELELI